jgi:hypothetical protein
MENLASARLFPRGILALIYFKGNVQFWALFVFINLLSPFLFLLMLLFLEELLSSRPLS